MAYDTTAVKWNQDDLIQFRIVYSYTVGTTVINVDYVIPVISGSITIEAPSDRIHVLDLRNVNWNDLPIEYSATLSALMVDSVGKHLTNATIYRSEIIIIASKKSSGDNWTMNTVTLSKGKITRAEMTNFTVRGAPVMNASCEFLNFAFTGK
jgi:hypothetical protein